jgi:pimeloyl-ACP methyl ester carboxylesterase
VSLFVLVHGAWHRGAHWAPLVPELEERGHRAVAVDLPCEDPGSGVERYAETVAEAVEDAGGFRDVALVGHSLGGATIPLVAEEQPVRLLVYLCALVPVPGRAMRDVIREEAALLPGFGAETVRDELGRTRWPDPEPAIRSLYHDCPRELAERAAAKLRAQARRPLAEPCPLARLPAVPHASIVCRDDRAIDPGWARRTARERLEVGAVELAGGHSPFLAQPARLAAVLDELVRAS